MADDMTFRASMVLDIRDALSSYTKLRQEHLSTVSALGAGAGALTAIGAGFAAAGVGLGAGLLSASLAAGEFERKLDYFTAVAGPGAADQYDKVSQKALQLGSDTIFSANEIADSFVELAKSGVGVEELLDGIGEATTSLAAATDFPLEESAKSLTTVLNTFGLEAKDAVDVVDKLAGAANASSIDIADLIYTVTYAGSNAKTAGIKFEDLNAAIAFLGEAGIKSSKAGTGLRQLLDKLPAPTKAGTAALKELGVITEKSGNQLLTAEGTLKSLPEVLDILNASLEGLKPNEKIDILGKIFPITSMPTILKLIDGGSAALAQLNKEIDKTTALDVANARLDNFSGDIEILRGNLETLQVQVGLVSQGALRGLTQGLVNVTQWLNNLEPSVLSLIVGITATVAVVLTFIGVAGLMAGALFNIYQMSLILAPAITTLIKLVPGLTFVLARLRAVMLFPGTPIIAVFLAIAAALYFFFTQTERGQGVWAGLVKWFQATMTYLKPLTDAFMALASAVGGCVTEAFGGFMPMLERVGEFLGRVLAPYVDIAIKALYLLRDAFNGVSIVGTGGSFVGPLMDIFTNMATGIISIGPVLVTALTQMLAQLLPPLIAMLPQFINGAFTLFMGLVQGLLRVLPLIIMGLTTFISSFITGLLTALPLLIQGAVVLFSGLVQALVLILPVLINGLLSVVAQLIPVIVSLLPLILEAAITLFMALVEAVVTVIPLLITTLFESLPLIIETVLSLVPTLVEAAITLFLAIVLGLANALPTIIGALVAALPQLVAAVISAIPIMLQGAIRLFIAILQALPQVIPQIISALIGMVPQLVSALIGMVPQIINAGVQLFGSLAQSIPRVLPQLVSSLVNMGGQLMSGLTQGIANAAGNVINAIGGAINGAIDWARGALGIHSPSRVFRKIGTQTIQGMIVGMDHMKSGLQRQFGMVTDSLDTFYDQVYAAREFDVMMNLQNQLQAPQLSMGTQFDELNQQLAAIAQKDTVNIEKLEVTKEDGEQLDESLPKAIRRTTYLVG